MRNWTINITLKCLILMALVFVVSFPDVAYAVPDWKDLVFCDGLNCGFTLDSAIFGLGYTCNAETGIAIGPLYNNGVAACEIDMRHIFSSFVCSFEDLASEIFGDLLCAMVSNLRGVVFAALTLFVVVFGVMLLMGMTPFTAREVTVIFLKFILVTVFATEATFLVQYIYSGFMGFMQDSIVVVLRHVGTDSLSLGGGGGLLDRMDDLVHDVIYSMDKGEDCEGGALAMMAMFTMSVPPLAMIGIMMLFKLFMVLVRAVLGYLFAVTGIMFLVTLAPIFLSFALFNITMPFFTKWLKYLMSFALQLMIVFAFIGFVISLDVGEDFRELFDLAAPYTQTKWADNARVGFDNVCTFCQGEVNADGTQAAGVDADGTPECRQDGGKNAEGMDPFAQFANLEFMNWIGTRIVYLLMLAYVLDAILSVAPQLSLHLSGANRAPTLGGNSHGGNDIPLAGATLFRGAGSNFTKAFRGTGGGLDKKIVGGATAAGKPVASSTVTNIATSLIGRR